MSIPINALTILAVVASGCIDRSPMQARSALGPDQGAGAGDAASGGDGVGGDGLPTNPITVTADSMRPDPPTAGRRLVHVSFRVANAAPETAVIIGHVLVFTRSPAGGVSWVPEQLGTVSLPPLGSAALAYRVTTATEITTAETLTAVASVTVQLAGRVVQSQSPTAAWTVAAPLPPTDSDGDGLDDVDELVIGTSPTARDTDNDLFDDAVEVGPTPGAPLDTDGDLLIDALDDDSDGGSELDRHEFLHGRDRRDPSDDVLPAQLLVTTAIDELDGPTTMTDTAAAGASLSLREAMHVASNRAGADLILFSPTAFPIGGNTVINVGAAGVMTPLPQLIDAETAIDALPDTVVLDGGGTGRGLTRAFVVRADNVRVSGLEARNFQSGSAPTICVDVASARGAALDGVTLSCDGLYGSNAIKADTADDLTVAASSVRGGSTVIRVDFSARLRILDNEVTGGGDQGTYLENVTGVELARSRFSQGREGLHLCMASGVAIRHSRFDHNGDGLTAYIVDGLVVTECTIDANTGRGIRLRSDVADIVLSRNVVFGNGGSGITDDEPEVAPPVLTSFDGTSIAGTSTAADGSLVQVFLDESDQGEVFVGEGLVAGGVFQVPLSLLPDPVPTRLLSFTAIVTDATVPGSSLFSLPLAR